MNDVRTRLVALRDRALVESKPLYGDAMPAKPRVAAMPTSVTARPKKSPMLPLAIGSVVLAAFAVAAVVVMKPAPAPVTPPPVVVEKPVVPTGPRPGKVTLSTNAQSMRVYLDKSATEKSPQPAAAGGGNLRVTVPPNVDWVLRVEAEGFKTHTLPLRIGDGEETALPVVLQPDAPVPTAVVAKKGGSSTPKKVVDEPKPPAEKKIDNGKFLDPFEANSCAPRCCCSARPSPSPTSPRSIR